MIWTSHRSAPKPTIGRRWRADRPGGKSIPLPAGVREDAPFQSHLEVSPVVGGVVARAGGWAVSAAAASSGGASGRRPAVRASPPRPVARPGRSGGRPSPALSGRPKRRCRLSAPGESGVRLRSARAGWTPASAITSSPRPIFRGWGADRLKQAGKVSTSRSMIGFTSWGMPASRGVAGR